MKNLFILIVALLVIISCQDNSDSFEETGEILGKNGKTKDYVLKELPKLGLLYGIILDVNNKGIMVGDGVWVNNELSYLDQGNFLYSEGNAINNQGQIVGFIADYNGYSPAFWNSFDSEAIELPTGLFSVGYARDINEDGIIVGFVGDPGRMPSIWENGELEILPLTEGGSSGWADGINLNGDIVGMVDGKPVIWKNRIPIPLEPYGYDGIAWQINDKGQIVGRLDGKPVFWNEQLEPTFLQGGSLGGAAWDINNRGDIVGWVENEKAALWRKGELILLTDGSRPFDASGLNESGVIVGNLATGGNFPSNPAYEPFYWEYE